MASANNASGVGGEPSKNNNNDREESPLSEVDDLKSQEWEKRLASGDLPEDFLKVTEPKNSPRPGGQRGAPGQEPVINQGRMASNMAFEPETAQLLDLEQEPQSSQVRKTSSTASAADHQQVPPIDRSVKPDRPMSTEEQDRALAMALQEQLDMEEAEAAGGNRGGAGGGAPIMPGYPAGLATRTVAAPENMIGKLTVTVVEARLAKNYGYTRMDPYCRVRVGHSVYETPTCANGSKEPKWNKTFTCYLLQGIKNVDVEVYDECTVRQDSLIAYGSFPLPSSVLEKHEVSDEWFSLSGNEGAGKEGMIHIILSLQPIAPGQPMTIQAPMRPVPNLAAGGQPMAFQNAYLPGGQQQQPPPVQEQPPPPKLSDEEMAEFVKMFPNLDQEIILSVFHSCRGNKEEMVNNLLQMSQQ